MVCVALLSNPKSTGNRQTLPRVRSYCASNPDIFHYEVEHVDQIGRALQTIARVDPVVIDVEVRHRPHGRRVQRRHEHPVLTQLGAERRRVSDIEAHDVRVHDRWVDRDAGQLREPLGEGRRAGVVVGQAVDVVMQKLKG